MAACIWMPAHLQLARHIAAAAAASRAGLGVGRWSGLFARAAAAAAAAMGGGGGAWAAAGERAAGWGGGVGAAYMRRQRYRAAVPHENRVPLQLTLPASVGWVIEPLRWLGGSQASIMMHGSVMLLTVVSI